MPVRAESDPRYYRRFIIMGIAALGFAAWSLYDGAIGYPAKQERAVAFKKLMDEGRIDDWNTYASERGWRTSFPGDPKAEDEFRGSIMMQYFMAAVTGMVGAWLLWGVWRARGRWIESTDTGIASSWGQTLNYDQVVSVDKRKWRSKGIAKVAYNDNGRKRRFVVDDYKFHRNPTGQVLRDLEANIDPALIAGGPPEAAADESELIEEEENGRAVEKERSSGVVE
jgi:hypothetical protein